MYEKIENYVVSLSFLSKKFRFSVREIFKKGAPYRLCFCCKDKEILHPFSKEFIWLRSGEILFLLILFNALFFSFFSSLFQCLKKHFFDLNFMKYDYLLFVTSYNFFIFVEAIESLLFAFCKISTVSSVLSEFIEYKLFLPHIKFKKIDIFWALRRDNKRWGLRSKQVIKLTLWTTS